MRRNNSGGPGRDRRPTPATAKRRESAPSVTAGGDSATVARELGDARRRRQDAAARMAPLACGCSDPLICDLNRWCPFWDGPRRWRAAS
jgi:hypothetical protein